MSVNIICRSRTCVNQIGEPVSTHILYRTALSPRLTTSAQDSDWFSLNMKVLGHMMSMSSVADVVMSSSVVFRFLTCL